MYKRAYIYIYIYIYRKLFTNVHIYIYVYIYAYQYIRKNTYICTREKQHIHKHTDIQLHTNLGTPTHKREQQK